MRVEIICRHPERFLNLCASNDVELWGLERVGDAPDAGEIRGGVVLRVYMRASGFLRMRPLSGEHGFEIRRVTRRGAPVLIRKLRRRYILIAGLVMCVFITRALSLFVWDIRVLGNERVPAARILESLKTLGFSYGSFGPAIKSEQLANELILEIPELSWFAVNISGSRADVLVRERVLPPEIVYGDTPSMVVAKKSGVILKLSVLEGAALVKPGDTVEKGELLVTGILDSRGSGRRAVHALAEIEARTWYEFSAKMPSASVVKRYTGEKKRRRAIIIAGKKINLYFSSGILWSSYDKITETRRLTLPGGGLLPVSLVTDSFLRYEPVSTRQSLERAEATLKSGLTKRLRDAVGDGEIIAVVWDTREENGAVTVTLRAECREQIAEARGFTEAELPKSELSKSEFSKIH
ncbi:MAG: sporulation protein YqfD [Oscillospiraceae bacterium]|nr:sporulation protein YqfD [Oscillospiraceae bacterium]